MQKKIFTYILCLFLSSSFFAITCECKADDALNKLGRGISNTLTGWSEFFVIIGKNWDENHSIPDAISSVPTAAFKASDRTFYGIHDIATFPYPGENNYGPTLLPELINTRSINTPIYGVEMESDNMPTDEEIQGYVHQRNKTLKRLAKKEKKRTLKLLKKELRKKKERDKDFQKILTKEKIRELNLRIRSLENNTPDDIAGDHL
ncbi:MAG: hypothetical protein KAI70_06030 [Candidatus Omnitrophica bacterium]|nr:hypothetical protein [Candidatus Omnitrophota bacterium]